MKNTASKEVNDSLPRIGPLSGQIPDGDLYPLRKITVDYDASRMMKDDVESVLHRHGLPLV